MDSALNPRDDCRIVSVLKMSSVSKAVAELFVLDVARKSGMNSGWGVARPWIMPSKQRNKKQRIRSWLIFMSWVHGRVDAC